jgi:hypothetical protein
MTRHPHRGMVGRYAPTAGISGRADSGMSAGFAGHAPPATWWRISHTELVTTLASDLAEWRDWDFAAFSLGRSLGLFPGWTFAVDAKGVFWTDNSLGNGLHDMLLALVAAGVLERRDGGDEQFRWLPNRVAEARSSS